MTNELLQRSLSAHARMLADWRRSRYNDDLRDKRNLVSAAGLDEIADYVDSLPPDDARLARLHQLCMRGESFEPGQQTNYELGRFRFFAPDAPLEGMLDQLVELAELDRGESGKFGGLQVPGDEPWN